MKRVSLAERKRGISPVIATVLLIGMVVVIGLIIFLWFRGMTEEAVVKFGKNAGLVCGDVQFEASYSSGTISISNTGNVPIYKMEIKIESGGSYETKDLDELVSGWPAAGINQGQVYSGGITGLASGDKITLIPVLVGSSNGAEKAYTCDDKYGYEITIA